MGVKQILEAQSVGFISLHDLLIRLTQIEGSTYQEAATCLYRLLDEKGSIDANGDEPPPYWYTNRVLEGMRIGTNSDRQDAELCLRQAALSGQPQEWSFDDEIPF